MDIGTRLAIHSLLLGIKLALVYDVLRIFRKIVRHRLIFIAAEDLAYWGYVFIVSFIMLYDKNNGSLRWFAVVGAFLGMAIYRNTISDTLVNAAVITLKHIFKLIYKIYLIIAYPLCLLAKYCKKMAIKAALGLSVRATRGGRRAKREAIRASRHARKRAIRANANIRAKLTRAKILAGKNKVAFRKWSRRKRAKLRKYMQKRR